MEFIDLKAQYQQLEERIQTRIAAVLAHGKYILGPEVQELEERLAEFSGVNHCVAVGNGTDALQLALMALDIGPGDAVFVPSFTFFASAEVISLVGATPVFVDIDVATYNMCPVSLQSRIEALQAESSLVPKAIIAVDLFGLPANYAALERVARDAGLRLIEDAAQSFGASMGSKKTGSFGDVATTSFFPAKPLGCYGDGGAVFTDDDELASLLRSLRVHGKGVDKYDNVRIGMNSRLDTLQAAILLEKLAVYPQEIVRRDAIAQRYQSALAAAFHVTRVPEGCQSVWAQYTLRSRLGDREMIRASLSERDIPTAVYYGCGVHQQTAYAKAEHFALPVTEAVQAEVFSVPMSPYLSTEDQDAVIEALLAS